MSKTSIDVKKTSAEVSKEKRGKEAFREIKARNRYMYIYNRQGIIIGTLLIFLLFLQTGLLLFFLNQARPNQYIPVDNEMRYFSPTPLSQHNRSDSEIQTFTMSTIKDLLSYDYINYNEQLLKHQIKFTGDGFTDFTKDMNDSFILQTVQDNKWISTFKNTTLPVIKKKGVDSNGVAYWLVEMEGINSFIGYDSTRNDVVSLKLKIERISTLTQEEGLGIAAFNYLAKTN